MGWAVPAQEVFDRLAQRPILVLFLLCALAWAPGMFSIPPLDRDESRFAEASKQMIETGDYVDIRFSTVPRYNKPVGVYWLQSASTLVFGRPPYNAIWTYRLPSLLGGFLAVLFTYWCARAFASPRTALIAAALLAVTAALTVEAKIATTDSLLLATIAAAQGVLLRAYLFARARLAEAPSFWAALGGWFALGCGILLKGPVILAVAGLTVVAITLWDRDWKWLRTIRAGPGVLAALAIVLPWAIAIALASHGAFYRQSLGHDFAAKILGGQESHGAPPGYYLALASVTFWPATLFALPAIGFAIVRRGEPAVRYLLAWAAPSWLMFELVPTKLPHYILPVYPALALLIGLWMTAPRLSSPAGLWQRALGAVARFQFIIVAVAGAAAAVFLPLRFGVAAPWWAVAAALLVLAIAAATVLASVLKISNLAAAGAIATAVPLYILLAAGVAPQLNRLWMSPRIAAHVAADRVTGDPPVVLAGYVEPSLVFLLGSDTHIESGKSAAAIAARQGGLALIDDRQSKAFVNALHAAHSRARAVDEVSGFNYSRGRREQVTFYRVTPSGKPPPLR